MILIDNISPHTEAEFHPVNVVGESKWCHLISDTSLIELQTFVSANTVALGAGVEAIRTPLLGSNVTYMALNQAHRDAAIVCGATETSGRAGFGQVFDSPPNHRGVYEP